MQPCSKVRGPLSALILSLIYCQFVKSEEKCPSRSFYVENNAVVEGAILEEFPSNDLDECARRCSKNFKCNGANFVLSLQSQPYCMLIDSKAGNASSYSGRLPIASSVVYALRSYCAEKSSCGNREWSYERYAGNDLLNEDFLRDCEAAFYSEKRSECRLSRVSLNNVNGRRRYFKRADDDVALYESNCPKRQFDTSSCGFVRVNQAGFVDVFDSRLDSIRTLAECEERCLEWHEGTCRSYTYNSQTRQCFISHSSQKALGRSVFESLGDGLSSGELDDCINFKLDCLGKSLTLTGRSMKLFKGSVKAKRGREMLCERNITESYKFDAEFLFDKCGIEREKSADLPTFSGLLFVKEGSTNLITIHDKVLEVKCQINDHPAPQQDTQLSFHFEVEDQNATQSLASKEAHTRYKLEVLNEEGRLADVVDVGKRGFLLVTVDSNASDGPNSDFIVSELVAQDDLNFVELIDKRGCVANTQMVKSLERIEPNKLKIGVVFGGFPDQSQVTYQTLVKPCSANCELECNKRFYVRSGNGTTPHPTPATLSHRRARRSPDNLRRFFFLSQELHRLRRSILVGRVKEDFRLIETDNTNNAQSGEKHGKEIAELMRLLQTENLSPNSVEAPPLPPVQNLNVQKRGDPLATTTNLWQCTEDMSCMFTMAIAFLQVFLMLSCACIVYKYLKKWITYYRRRGGDERRRSSAEEVHYGVGADASFMDSQTSTSFNSSSRQTQITTALQPTKQ